MPVETDEFTIDDFEHSYPQWTRRSYYQNKRCEEYVEYIKNELVKQNVNIDDEFPKPFVPLIISSWGAFTFVVGAVGVLAAVGAVLGVTFVGTPIAGIALMATATYLIPAIFGVSFFTFLDFRRNYKSNLKNFGTYPPNKLLALAEKYHIKKPPSIPQRSSSIRQTSVNSEYDANDIRRSSSSSSSSTARSSNPYPKLKGAFEYRGTSLEEALSDIIKNPVTKYISYASQNEAVTRVHSNKITIAQYQNLPTDIKSLLYQEVLLNHQNEFSTLLNQSIEGSKENFGVVYSRYLDQKTRTEADKNMLLKAVKTISQQKTRAAEQARGGGSSASNGASLNH